MPRRQRARPGLSAALLLDCLQTDWRTSMPRGIIERITPEEGFGFVSSGGQEYFFHRTGLNATEFEELAPGMAVEFSVNPHAQGDEPGEHPRAVNVRIVEDVMPADEHEPLPPDKLGRQALRPVARRTHG